MSTTPPPPSYGTAPIGGQPADHPKATLALVLSIVSYFVCGLILSIPAFIIAKGAEKEVLASNGTIGGAGKLKAAKILALINIILGVIGLVIVIILIATGAFNSDMQVDTTTGY